MKGGVIMEFSIEAFKHSLTVETLYSCRKSDLILVADYYDISLSKVATKQAIRDVVLRDVTGVTGCQRCFCDGRSRSRGFR